MIDIVDLGVIYLHSAKDVNIESEPYQANDWITAREEQLDLLCEIVHSRLSINDTGAEVISCVREADGRRMLGVVFASSLAEAKHAASQQLVKLGFCDITFASEQGSHALRLSLRNKPSRDQCASVLRLLTHRMPRFNTHSSSNRSVRHLSA